ncbi:MAG: hypothetical protein ABI760_19675 [Ferruginibacter sp.]
MQRRSFIKNTALCAVAVSSSGFIRFDGNQYSGDCETTTDILGPFYRPGSPVRNNLVLQGAKGNLIELSGMIKHKDCKTPYKKAKIELWHCNSDGVYDNGTNEFHYRGTTFSDEKGHYSFNTILPVPYGIGDGRFRPAHFHLMITAEGYQPLVTQLYFSGDTHISKDLYASSPIAKGRILDVQNLSNGTKRVTYDVSMSTILTAEPAAIEKIIGVYTDEKDKNKKTVLFKRNNVLWMKNEVFGENFEYTGNNEFTYPSLPPGLYATLRFEIIPSGAVKLIFSYNDDDLVKHTEESVKEK